MGLDNPIHLMFLLVVLLLVFGAKRLPELGHSLGTGLRGFKDAIGGDGAQPTSSAMTQDHSQPQASLASVPAPVPTTSAPTVASEPDDRAA
jgi:sec-independent protein translocase protein TatA